jgi:hypothetical protein
MTPSEAIITQPAVSKTFEYPEDKKNEPQYLAADAYYEFQITLSQDVIYEEATDEEFFLAAISSNAYESWLDEEEDIVDYDKLKPL